MIADHDQREIRCRRLGHEVTFRYCRTQEGASLCPLIFDCWWETFDVYGFLQAHCPPDELAKTASYQPRHKVLALLELVRQAQEGAGQAVESGAQPRTGGSDVLPLDDCPGAGR